MKYAIQDNMTKLFYRGHRYGQPSSPGCWGSLDQARIYNLGCAKRIIKGAWVGRKRGIIKKGKRVGVRKGTPYHTKFCPGLHQIVGFDLVGYGRPFALLPTPDGIGRVI